MPQVPVEAIRALQAARIAALEDEVEILKLRAKHPKLEAYVSELEGIRHEHWQLGEYFRTAVLIMVENGLQNEWRKQYPKLKEDVIESFYQMPQG